MVMVWPLPQLHALSPGFDGTGVAETGTPHPGLAGEQSYRAGDPVRRYRLPPLVLRASTLRSAVRSRAADAELYEAIWSSRVGSTESTGGRDPDSNHDGHR